MTLNSRPLRSYQERALSEVLSAFEGGALGVLLVLPTGTGKTRTAAELVRRHDGLTLWLAPRAELVAQARGVLPSGVLVHTIQAESVRERSEDVDLIVLDEARHYLSDEWSLIRGRYPYARVLGLDATPARSDGRGLGSMFDALVTGLSVREATGAGYLVPCEVLAPERALGPGELAQTPLDAYQQHARGSAAVVFCASVEAAQHEATYFGSAGWRAAAVWGEMPARERADTLEAYEAGELDVLTNAMLLTEGWDSPRTETVILARGCSTPGAYLQMVGRALRPYPGKERALLLDLRGVSHAHGAPDEDRVYSLDGAGIRRLGSVEARFCPVCGGVVEQLPCDGCGHVGELRVRRPRVLGLALERFAGKRAEGDDKRAATLGRWLAEARKHGRRSGWAAHRYRAVYGDWPSKEIMARASARS